MTVTPKLRRTRFMFVLAVPVCALLACSKPPPKPLPPRPLKVLKVGAGGTAINGLPIRSYSGEVRPRYFSLLAFRVGGKIVSRLANVGDHVVAGQVLARLDPTDLNLAASQARANLAQVSADAKRYRDLHASQFVGQAALDARENALVAARAQEALTRNQERYSLLRADKDGIIGTVQADIGKVVAAGEVVFSLAPDGDREVALSIPETEYARFHVGMSAEVSLYAMPGKTFKGTVRELSTTADSATRTYPMRIRVNGIEKWPTGLTANVRFPGMREADDVSSLLSIPLTALFQQGEGAAVWIVEKGDTVTLRPVQIERYADDAVFIKSGLLKGERIAAAGVHQLFAGEKVRVVDIAPTTPSIGTNPQ